MPYPNSRCYAKRSPSSPGDEIIVTLDLVLSFAQVAIQLCQRARGWGGGQEQAQGGLGLGFAGPTSPGV
jgi:hypothetical protein